MVDRRSRRDAPPDSRQREASSLPSHPTPPHGGRRRFGMTRCLPDATLVWLRAGNGGADERAHVTACGVCGDRYRRLGRELTTVRYVLLHTDEPGTRVVARTRS